MEWAEVVRRRRMVRSYEPGRPVPHEVLDRLVRAALRGPSAGWSQGVELVVLADDAARQAFWASTTDPAAREDAWLRGMRTAPALVVVWSDRERYLDRYAEADKGWTDRDQGRWPVPWWDVDAGMAALLLLQGAVDAGLGACLFGVPGHRWADLRQALGVPASLRPVAVVSLGWSAPGSPSPSPSLRRGRRPVGEVVHAGRWGRPWP